MSGSIFEFSQDLNDAKPPPPLPVGPYPAEIVGAQWRVSNTSGKEYANIIFRIGAESYPADYVDGNPDGTELPYNRLQKEDTAQARWRWRQFMERVGGPLSRNIDLNTLIGLTGTVDVSHQDYEGEQRAQIARVLAP
jgi:hypothetical protein